MRASRLLSALVFSVLSSGLTAADSDKSNGSPLRRMNDDVVRVARESLGAREFAPSMAVDRFTAAVLADVKMDRQQEGRASDAARVANATGTANPGLGARRGELRTLRGATLEELSAMRAKLVNLGNAQGVSHLDSVTDQVTERFDRVEALLARVESAKSESDRNRARQALADALESLRPPAELPSAVPPASMREGRRASEPDTSRPSKALPQYALNAPPATHIGYENAQGVFVKVLQPAVLPVDARADCNAVDADLQEDASGPSAGNVSLAPEIRALAESLGYSPARILRWMHQNIAFEPYWGALKGAETVLQTRGGNSTDQASLLISLLRASNVPARYVRGTVRLLDPVSTNTSEGRAQRWLGTKTYQGSVGYLTGGGVPAGRQLQGSAEVGIYFDHVWVQACLPSSGYRGYALEQTGYRWLPLDPAVKDSGYEARISVDVPLTDASFYNTLLAARTDKLPQEILADQIEAEARSVQSGAALPDVLPVSRPKVAKYDVLPITLPYEVIQFTNWSGSSSPEAAVIPDQHQTKFDVRLLKKLGNNQLQQWLTATFTFPRDLTKRITVGYRPTAATLSEWNAWAGDIGALPSGAVRVVPQIRVNGTTMAEAAESTSEPLAYSHSLVMKIRHADTSTGQCVKDDGTITDGADEGSEPDYDPDATCLNKTVYQSVKAGAYFALGANGRQHSQRYFESVLDRLSAAVNSTPTPPTPANGAAYESTVGDFLHLVLQSYIAQADEAEVFLAESRGHRSAGIYDLGLTTSTLATRYVFDVPVAVTPGGALIDFIGGLYLFSSVSASVPATAAELAALKDLARFNIYAGSALEHHVWQEAMRTDAVSTVRGLQFASEAGIPLRRIDKNNIAQYSTLTDSSMAPYQTAVAAAVAGSDGGNHGVVTVPASAIAYPDPVEPLKKWRGAVFMSENSVTGEYGAIIAGSVVAGGGYSLANQSPLNILYTPSPSAPSTVASSNGGQGLFSILPGGREGFDRFVTTVGDPVNPLTGNYIHSEVDFKIRARGGLPVVFERWYNAQTPEDGPLGFGWTHSLNHQLRFYGVEGGLAKVGWVNGTGGEQFFSTTSHTSGNVAAGAQLTAQPGTFSRLTRLADGTGRFRITETGGLSYTFDQPGTLPSVLQTPASAPRARLLAIADRYGNTLTLNYTGSQLSSLSDSLGRTVLTFTWTGNRITQVKDLANRTVLFGYEDGQGNLTRVQNPKGEVSTYSYYTSADGPQLNHALRRHTKPRGNGIEFEYYASGQVFRHTNFDVGGSLIPESALTFHYNPFRRETWTVDSRGAETRFQFDERGNTISQSIGNGGQYVYSYAHPSNPHLRTSMVDPSGRQTSYTYTAEGYLETVTQPSGVVSEMRDYTSFGEARRIKDARGNWTLRHFDANGSLTDEVRLRAGVVPVVGSSPSVTDVLAWTKFQSDQSGNVTGTKRLRSFTEASLGDFGSGSGPVVTATYDGSRFNRQSLTRAGNRNGQTVTETTPTFGYDTLGRMIAGVDGRWYPVSFDYDPLDRVHRMLDGLGQPRELTFDPNGNLTALELVSGSNRFDSMTAVFDGQDRMVRRLDNAGNRTAWAYDGVGNVLEVQGPDGYRIGFAYDLANRPYAAFDEQGRVVVTSRDVLGRPLAVTDPAGASTEYDYHGDAQDGRLARIRVPAIPGQSSGRAVEFDYDAGGIPTQTRRVSAGGAARASLSFTDALGRIVRSLSESDDQGQRLQTCYRFDGLSNLTEVWAGSTTDTTSTQCNFADSALKLQQSSTWDDFGNELSRTDALGRTWQFRYDYNGNLESSQTPEQAQAGTRTTYSYDASLRGLLRSRTVPGSTTTGQTVTWTRNPLGQVTRAETRDGGGAAVVAYDYTFDVAHRLASVSDSRTGRTIVYGWTPGGRLSSIALGSEPGSPLWRFQYDGTGRLTGIAAPNGQTVAMSLDAVGRLTEKVWPDGARSTYAWHPEGSLASVTHAAGSRVLFAQHFGFDDWGNRNSSTETHDLTAISRSYTYDARDRLKTETTNGVTRSFGFDVFGNRTSRTEGSSTTNYLFDAAHQLKEIQGGASGRLVYDRNGNLKKYCSGGASGSESDCTGTDVLTLAWDGLNQLIEASRAGSTETYAYDDNGRRIRKSAGGSSTHYQYDGPDILAEFSNPAGAPTALYVHGAGMDEPLMRLTGDVGAPQAQVAYYAQDGVGSVVATFGEPEASVNLAREAGVSIAQGAGGAYTVGGVTSNPATLNNGETRASGGHWTVTSGRTLDIQLAGSRSVSEVVLIGNPGTVDDAAPSETSTWASNSQFDTSTYTVQTWSGSAWQTVASRSGNTKHIVRLAFAPVTTDRIRVIPVDDASNGQTANDNLVSLTEIEVRSPAGAGQIRTQRFDAWGRLEQAAGSVPTYGYTGREPDATGLIHYRARYYHPELGRFVSKDPLGLSAGINPYAYADGNPVLFNDPDGLMAALAWNSANQYYNDYQVGTRVQGALQFGAGLGMGALGTGVGVTTGWTGLGAVGGGALIALGSDQMSAGFQTLVSGKSTPSLLNQGLQAAGASPTQAAWGEAAITIGASGGVSMLSQSGRSFVQTAGVADDVFAAQGAVPGIKAGAAGGETAGKAFPQAVKDAANAENPLKVCVYCPP
jgi:RHS repeat-associated protein